MKEFEEKYPYFWLILGLILTLFSYGIFNTGICAWIFAIPLIRFINNRTKWSSIFLMLAGMIVVANIAFFRLVLDDFHIMNQVFCSLNGIRMWFPFFVYFLCRCFGARKIIAYYALPAAVAVAEFFIDNPFISVMTSLSVSQFWNLGLMQVASVTGVVGVSFIVTLFACIVNYIWEEGLRKDTVINVIAYGLVVVTITSIGMMNIEKITTTDQTVRVATSVENFNLLTGDPSILNQYDGSDEEKMFQANIDIITERARQAVQNESTLLVFPEDAFICPEAACEAFIGQVEGIAKDNGINILLPVLRLPEEEGGKTKNTLNFISSRGELLNTYLKNHLVPVVEEPETERGDGKTPTVEVDGVVYTYYCFYDWNGLSSRVGKRQPSSRS